MKIKVKNLLPNPFRNMDAYPIDREKIEQLRNSIRETTFWDNILARSVPEAGGKFEIAYGHHRLVAIKEELGEDTVVDIPVRDLSDENMLKIMANENMEEWTSNWRVIVETVKQTKKFLEEHIEIAKKYGDLTKAVQKELGTPIISHFLGKNWPQSRITRALAVMKDREITLLKRSDKEKLDITTLATISSIQDREVKKQWMNEVRNKDISTLEMEQIARFENDPTLTSQDKETLRALVQQDELRGKEQIRRKHQIYKAQRLTIPKTTPERERKKKQIEEHLLEIAKDGTHLAELISTLAAQISSYPETLELFPREETLKANSAMHDLLRAIRAYREKFDIAKSRMKEKTGIEEAAIEGVRIPKS